jgi:DNA topoisomerase-1
LRFPGKSGHKWSLVLDEPSLAALVSGLKTRGRAARLFAWRDDEGLWHALAPAEINAYVRERTGGDFTAKDFRTLAGTAAAAMSLAKAGSMVSEASRKRAVTTAMRDAADALGNTAAIARKSYVDPRVVALFERGKTLDGGDRRAVETRLLELLT